MTLGMDCVSEFPISYADFGVLVPDYAGLGFLHTGAATVGASQPEQASSLGGNVSDTIATRVGIDEVVTIPMVEILDASHQVGNGSLFPVGGTALTYAGPNATPGPTVTPSVGVPVGVSDSLGQWVLVNRTESESMAGITTAVFVDQYNNVFGGNNATVAGETTYRAVIVNNTAFHPFWNLTFSVGVIETTTCTVPLPTSGAGSITGTFAAFPWSGFCEASSGEIFYYSTRTNEVLTVPASGRGLLGTSTTGGMAGDTINCISPIQLATETPVSNAIQTIANETTAPTGLTFASSVTIPELMVGQQMGLWIKRVLPSGMTAYPEFAVSISLSYSVDLTTNSDELVGLYRVADSTLERYELYIGQDAAPDLTGSPTATFISSPYSTSLAAGHTYYLSTARRNQYNLVTENTDFTVIVVNGGGGQGSPPPSAPANVAITALGNTGKFQVTASYYFSADSPPADNFYVYISFDGSAPLTETPIAVPVGGNLGGVNFLNYITSAQTIPTTARCVVQMYCSTTGETSTNTNEVDATSELTAFANLGVKGFYSQLFQQMD